MAVFGDRIQALMDEVYNEWQKEENKGKGKWDILDGFSEAHQIAVVCGNFNYQVENGGIEQWIDNGYFHEDAEKLIEHLEIGAKSDERCQTILDSIYILEQHAREKDCDRDGSYVNPYDEDGERRSIGDMINCGAFDTWYYEHCGEEDWWETVCGIIDQAEPHKIMPARQNEEKGENADAPPPIKVYIENARDSSIGGFTIPLPTTKKTLAPWLAAIEVDANDPGSIAVQDVISEVIPLKTGLAIELTVHTQFNELNYLAAKVGKLSAFQKELYIAALEAGNHSENAKDLINLAENIDRFDLQPAFNEAQYGEFQLQMYKDNTSGVFERLEKSDNMEERELAQYILKLEAYADAKAFGRGEAKEENGVFTKHGYIVERGEFEEVYHGVEDILREYRLFPITAQVQEEKTAAPQREIPPGIRSDEMLGRYLYDNKMMSEDDLQAARARLNYTAYPEDYYRLIGKRRRETANGSYSEGGYVEKTSVLEQIAAARAEQRAGDSIDHSNGRNEKNKGREPEL
jgi:hypothetical protein